jgi:hypothetical protein
MKKNLKFEHFKYSFRGFFPFFVQVTMSVVWIFRLSLAASPVVETLQNSCLALAITRIFPSGFSFFFFRLAANQVLKKDNTSLPFD